MKLWLIRHAATQENDQRRYSTQGEGSPLSAVGRTQCARFGTSGAHLTVYTSNTLRGRETAKLLFPNAHLITCDSLTEMDFGEFAGKSADELAGDARYQKWVDGGCRTCPPGGESTEDLKERVLETLVMLVSEAKARGDENLIICCHAGTIMAALSAAYDGAPAEGEDTDDFFRWHVPCVRGYAATIVDDSLELRLTGIERVEHMPAALKEESSSKGADKRESGILVGISVGPGDPELMTMAAVRAIHDADVIFCVKNGGKGIAEGIARPFIDATTPIHRLAIDMGESPVVRKRAYQEAADRIERHLLKGENVGYLCLGDVCLYSSFGHVAKRIEERGHAVKYIPGVTSVSAAAAATKTPLAQGTDRLLVMSASSLKDKDDPLTFDANKAILKLDSHYGRLWKRMQETSDYEATLVESVGLKGERIKRPLEADAEPNYLSLVIVTKTKDAD